MNKAQKNKSNQKGAITILTVSVLVFIFIIITVVYVRIINKIEIQEKVTDSIVEEYKTQSDEKSMEKEYNKIEK